MAGRIPQHFIDELIARTDIVEVIGASVSLRKRAIDTPAERIAAVFRLSGEGDLSTPTDARGVGEFHTLGKQVDAARARTLEVIEGIRAEVDLMRKESLPEDEFMKRWEGLKEKIGRLAP